MRLVQDNLRIDAAKSGTELPEGRIYVCSICGNMVKNDVPGKCLVCDFTKKQFQEIDGARPRAANLVAFKIVRFLG
jgi:hypothetical protein